MREKRRMQIGPAAPASNERSKKARKSGNGKKWLFLWFLYHVNSLDESLYTRPSPGKIPAFR